MGLVKTYREADSLLFSLSADTIILNKKEKIFQNETTEDKIAIVLEGMVYLCMEDEDLERNILLFFRPGDTFHAGLFLHSGENSSYLLTKTNSRIAVISSKELIRFGMDNPSSQKLINQLLLSPQNALIHHCHILQQKTIRKKLTEFFTLECTRQRSSRMELPIPFADLAEYLAVDRTSMMKELGKMKQDGMLAGKNRKLTINFYQYLS